MIKNFKAIFFDAGNTLFHPYPSVGHVYGEVASRYGCRAGADEIESAFRRVWVKHDGLTSLDGGLDENAEKGWWRGLVREVFAGFGGVENFERFFEELYDVFASSRVWRLYPEVTGVLAELKKRKIPLGIVSNWDSRLFGICEGLGLAPYFDFVLASAVFGAAKPDPAIFREALRRANVGGRQAVHVGDSLKDDVAGAHAAGIEVILVDRVREKRPGAGGGPPFFRTISGLGELIRDGEEG